MKPYVKTKFRNSLLSRYLMIIGFALVLVPILIPVSFAASWGVNRLLFPPAPGTVETVRDYGSGLDLETMWHGEAQALGGKDPQAIDGRLRQLKQEYPDASLFWVDGAGQTRLQLPERSGLPAKWSAEDAVAYMKRAVNADPFTIVAFIGSKKSPGNQGFMVFELPRAHMYKSSTERNGDSRFYGLFMFMMFAFFILISYLFFRDIRTRLLRLETGMARTGPNGLSVRVAEGRPDEIGRLEQAFNRMVGELGQSRQREREEEELRKSLIGNLSHDLRTPLTVLGGQLYSFRKEPLSEKGREVLALMEVKIKDLSTLIDHLLSYNLLSSGRYALNPEDRDVLRIVRVSAAAWYPLWEKAGIEADIDLPDEPLIWNIDEQGFRRVLDNLFQNLVRHAGSGGYVGISLAERHGKPALVIADRGPGLGTVSPSKGAGLGLQIVDLLLREMKLRRETESSPERGTRTYIFTAASAR